MAKTMHIIVSHSIKVVMQGVNVFSMNVDEVTIMEHQEWIIVHVYVMKHWHCIPILLTLEHVEVGATINHITTIILKCMVKCGGALCDKFGSRWVCLGWYGNYVV
jgi:hypothetical protein